MHTSRLHQLSSARQLFHDQGVVPEHAVAEPILRSWQRCADLGYDMLGPRTPELLTQTELRELQQRNEALRNLSRPAIDTLVETASQSDGLVLLTDASGMVLEAAGSIDFASRAAQVALMPGAAWNESAAGTNAIGTALIERRPITVHGGEHYFEPHRILTCAAVPITDPHGGIAGLLDLSSPASLGGPGAALAMVNQTVDRIERRMFTESCRHCLRVGLHTDRRLLDTEREGLLAFENGVLVAANRHALRLLDLDISALSVYRYEDLFLDSPGHAVNKGLLHRPHGMPLHAHIAFPGEPTPAIHAPAHKSPPCASRPIAPPKNQPDAPETGKAENYWFDAAMLNTLARAVRLLNAGVSVLLQGETGCGKEVFARRMHARSRRADAPFVAVNCAALPESLIESELFGYEEGAFTGARRQGNKGLLRQAEGGVLFLDEIGDMPLALQARLLRVLQSREVVPLGGGRPIPVDFALICATHHPLGPDAQDTLRADLYFRIAEYTVHLPALRERDDQEAVIHALWDAGNQNARAPLAMPGEVLHALARYNWPGNFRQLAATLRTLRVLAELEGAVRMDMLPEPLIGASAHLKSGKTACDAPDAHGPGKTGNNLKTLTRQAVREALAASKGNVSDAARRLGVHRSTLYRWANE